MAVTVRRYRLLEDYGRVGTMLVENFDGHGLNGNIPQPRWEYAHVHPSFNHKLTHRFGLWEDEGTLVAAAFFESDVGEAFLACRRGHEHLKPEMVEYAERELFAVRDGRKSLVVLACDFEKELGAFLEGRGYEKAGSEPVTIYDYAKRLPPATLPDGYAAISLAEENDLRKIDEVLWRGFNHGDESPYDLDCRLQMQSAPGFRKDLTTVIKDPEGRYVCFAGMWLDAENGYAYIEPLATDPGHRGLGLATAAVSIGMEKTRRAGATYCFGGAVGFYPKIGFETVYNMDAWKKSWV